VEVDPVTTYAEDRAARRLSYVIVLLQEAHVDPKKIPPGQVVFAMASPYEQRGVTSADIENWITACDPPVKPPRPKGDPIACFREKARAAMKDKPGIGLPLLAIGGAAFFAPFVVSRRRK
jgi:hypothetical protein